MITKEFLQENGFIYFKHSGAGMDSWRHKANDDLILRGSVDSLYVMAFDSIIRTKKDVLDLLRIAEVN